MSAQATKSARPSSTRATGHPDLRVARILVTGHTGMVGSAILRRLDAIGAANVIRQSSDELDLRRQHDVEAFLADQHPEVVIVAAGRVGGIYANATYPAQFAYDNLMIAANVIHGAFHNGVQRLLFLGSTCIYPCAADQPIPEEALLSGPLERTNEAYALAKIAGLKLCQYYRRQYGVTFHSAMPTNLYGPGDNYHPDNSHVLPALIHRFHEAKKKGHREVGIWGSGKPRREFLYVDDLADAIIHLLQLDDPPDWVNVGTGQDISIQELAELVAKIAGYDGRITNDLSKPDGTMLKRTDTTLINQIGWQPRIDFWTGIRMAYESFVTELESGSLRIK